MEGHGDFNPNTHFFMRGKNNNKYTVPSRSELGSCVKVDVAVLGFPFPIVEYILLYVHRSEMAYWGRGRGEGGGGRKKEGPTADTA